MYLQKLGQLQRNGLLGNLGMGSASGAEQMMAMGQQLAQMGGSNNQLERMKQMSQQSADQAMQMEKQRQAQQGSGLGSLLNLGLAAATGGVSGLAGAVGGELVSEMTGSPLLGMVASGGISNGLKSNGIKAAKLSDETKKLMSPVGKTAPWK